MEFHEKLQQLRKEKGMTQEELAGMLYVSRAAVSKWESGRGYPNIDSLKAIAKYFSVSMDFLLSGEEALSLAEEEKADTRDRFLDRVFGLLDVSGVLFLFLPFFGEAAGETVRTVSLPVLTGLQTYIKAVYYVAVIGMIGVGVLGLSGLGKGKRWISLAWNGAAVLLFIVSPQPYAAAFLFALMAIKVFLPVKKQ